MLPFSRHITILLFTVSFAIGLVCWCVSAFDKSVNHNLIENTCCDLGGSGHHTHESSFEDHEVTAIGVGVQFMPTLSVRVIANFCCQFSSRYVVSIWQPPKIL